MSVETADTAFQKGNAAFVDEQFESALRHYSTAIDLEPDNGEFWVKRAACYFQLKNFAASISDANKAIALMPQNPKGYYRKGVAAFAEEEFESAKAAFEKGLPVAGTETQSFKTWIRKCQAEIEEEDEDQPASSNSPQASPTQPATVSVATQQPAPAQQPTTTAPVRPAIRHEWFQTETHVTVSVFIKNVKKENVTVEIEPRALNVAVKLPGSSEVQVDFDLADEIVPADSKYEVLSTKIEIKLKKSRAARWQTLENTGANPVSTWDAKVEPTSVPAAKLYPSSKGAKDWDKIGSGEEEDKLEGDAALNKVFKDIYSNASEDQRRAMMKSFYESGGTVLSTNWQDVGKAPVQGSPPEGLEMKKWSDLHK